MIEGIFKDANWLIAYATIALVVATLILAGVAWRQLYSLRRTSQIDTVLKLRDGFFTKETSDYFKLIDNNLLKYDIGYYGFFITDTSQIEVNRKRFKNSYISPYDLDDRILGHIEDFGLLVKMNIIDFELIYSFFDTYIRSCGDNDEIMKYVLNVQQFYDNEAYSNFIYIYNKCKERYQARMIKEKPKYKKNP